MNDKSRRSTVSRADGIFSAVTAQIHKSVINLTQNPHNYVKRDCIFLTHGI